MRALQSRMAFQHPIFSPQLRILRRHRQKLPISSQRSMLRPNRHAQAKLLTPFERAHHSRQERCQRISEHLQKFVRLTPFHILVDVFVLMWITAHM